MILEISLKHDFLGGNATNDYYVGPDELEAGADIASHLNETERELFSPFTAVFAEDGTLEITCGDLRERFASGEQVCFKSPARYIKRPSVSIEGHDYDNDHEVYATVRSLPEVKPAWDMLKVTREGETALFKREELNVGDYIGEDLNGKRHDWLKNVKVTRKNDSELRLSYEDPIHKYADFWNVRLNCTDKTEVEQRGMTFSLLSLSTIITEWDMMENKPIYIRVSNDYLKSSQTEAEAAYLVAECVQEQYPEVLEVIAKYMRAAYELGSPEAEDWLKDYYSDDGRYDAYC